jgi:hypothetical protein
MRRPLASVDDAPPGYASIAISDDFLRVPFAAGRRILLDADT